MIVVILRKLRDLMFDAKPPRFLAVPPAPAMFAPCAMNCGQPADCGDGYPCSACSLDMFDAQALTPGLFHELCGTMDERDGRDRTPVATVDPNDFKITGTREDDGSGWGL